MVWWNVWVVEIFLLLGRVTHATAGTAALEAVAAFAAAGETTASATDNTPNNGENDETADDYHGDHWPPKGNILSVCSRNTAIEFPSGRCTGTYLQ